jgi:NAD+ synthase
MNLNSELLKINPEKVSQKLQNFIKTNTDELHRDGAIIGLSGGIDSASFSTYRDCTGRQQSSRLIMPERDSQPDSESDARPMQ